MAPAMLQGVERYTNGRVKSNPAVDKAWRLANPDKAKAYWTKQNKKQKETGWAKRKKWLVRNPDSRLLAYARTSAQRKSMECNITKEDVQVPSICPVLGIPLFFTVGKRTHNTPTVDRIDNAHGYVRGNVVVVSWRANDLKKDATADELRKLAAFYGEVS